VVHGLSSVERPLHATEQEMYNNCTVMCLLSSAGIKWRHSVPHFIIAYWAAVLVVGPSAHLVHRTLVKRRPVHHAISDVYFRTRRPLGLSKEPTMYTDTYTQLIFIGSGWWPNRVAWPDNSSPAMPGQEGSDRVRLDCKCLNHYMMWMNLMEKAASLTIGRQCWATWRRHAGGLRAYQRRATIGLRPVLTVLVKLWWSTQLSRKHYTALKLGRYGVSMRMICVVPGQTRE